MPGVIHLRPPGDVPQPGVLGDRRIFSAPAEALTGSADSLGGDFVVSLQKADIASSYRLFGWVRSICNANSRTAPTSAFPRWVRAARVVGLHRVSSGFPFRPMAYQIAKEFAGYLVRPARELCSRYGLPASAHTQPGRVGWGLNRPFGQVGGKPFRVVALDKAASSRWPRIFADDGRTATAFAGFRLSGRLLVGHGFLDRLSASAGECANTQPAFLL
jgi:hypothetical protein